MERLRLRHIEFNTSFIYSEWTNFCRIVKERKLKLKKDEGILMISCSLKQMIFVRATESVDWHPRNQPSASILAEICDSRRWRITGRGKWSPDMLNIYGEKVGFVLVGVKRFQDAYKYLLEGNE